MQLSLNNAVHYCSWLLKMQTANYDYYIFTILYFQIQKCRLATVYNVCIIIMQLMFFILLLKRYNAISESQTFYFVSKMTFHKKIRSVYTIIRQIDNKGFFSIYIKVKQKIRMFKQINNRKQNTISKKELFLAFQSIQWSVQPPFFSITFMSCPSIELVSVFICSRLM